MDPLTDAANVALMRAPPAIPPQRDDCTYTQVTSAGDMVNNTTWYWTPRPAPRAAIPAHPGESPAAPVAPIPPPAAGRGRPSAARLALVTQYNADLIAYPVDVAAYPGRLEAYNEALRLYQEYADNAENDAILDDGPPANPAPVRPNPDCIFTHGRESRLHNATIAAFSEGFARTHTILCFQDTGDLTTRVATFRSLMRRWPSVTAIGGRSMGARASCRAAIYSSIKKLIFFAYPLVSGLEERSEELLALDADTDVLFIVGDADARCVEILLQPLRQRMRARTWWIRVVGADHAMWYDDDQVRGTICNISGQIAAMWNIDGNRNPAATELTLQYDAAQQQVTWTGWMALQQ